MFVFNECKKNYKVLSQKIKSCYLTKFKVIEYFKISFFSPFNNLKKIVSWKHVFNFYYLQLQKSYITTLTVGAADLGGLRVLEGVSVPETPFWWDLVTFGTEAERCCFSCSVDGFDPMTLVKWSDCSFHVLQIYKENT